MALMESPFISGGALKQGLIDVRIDDHGALARLAKFPELKPVAIMRAINRTADHVRSRWVKAITSNVNVRPSDLDGRHTTGSVTARHASAGNLAAGVNVSGNRLPLSRFARGPMFTATGRQKLVKYAIWPGRVVTITTRVFPAVMKSGHIGYFQRVKSGYVRRDKSGSRIDRYGLHIGEKHGLPIAELFGPSIPRVLQNAPGFSAEEIQVDASATLEVQMAREVNFILTGTSKLQVTAGGGH